MNDNVNENVENLNPDQDLLEAFNELRRNTVSKETYEKLREQNQKLISSIVNGENDTFIQEENNNQPPKRTPEEIKKSIDDITSKLFSEDNNMTNLDNAKAIIQYHDDMLELYGVDVFANSGDKYMASQNDKTSPENTYKYLKECVDASQDDPTAFNVAFQAGLRQILPIKK